MEKSCIYISKIFKKCSSTGSSQEVTFLIFQPPPEPTISLTLLFDENGHWSNVYALCQSWQLWQSNTMVERTGSKFCTEQVLGIVLVSCVQDDGATGVNSSLTTDIIKPDIAPGRQNVDFWGSSCYQFLPLHSISMEVNCQIARDMYQICCLLIYL